MLEENKSYLPIINIKEKIKQTKQPSVYKTTVEMIVERANWETKFSFLSFHIVRLPTLTYSTSES
jgi:hypothetical protein